jgi:prepilin-type N-terminal cleavage/methylation domain-containing protein
MAGLNSQGAASGGRVSASRRGFSLIEVMVAMVVLAFGLLGMLMMQAQALDHSSRGREGSSALSIARNVFEQIPRVPFSTLPANNTWVSPAWIQNAGLNAGDASLADGVYGERVTDGSGNDHFQQMYRAWYRISPDPSAAADPRVRGVEVEVIWSDDGSVAVTPATRTNEKFIVLSGLIADNDL